MKKNKFKTLDGLYKALLPIVNNLVGGYKIEMNVEDVAIFCTSYEDEPFAGYAIIHLLPILKRATWMVRRNSYDKRVELLVWVDNDNK